MGPLLTQFSDTCGTVKLYSSRPSYRAGMAMTIHHFMSNSTSEYAKVTVTMHYTIWPCYFQTASSSLLHP